MGKILGRHFGREWYQAVWIPIILAILSLLLIHLSVKYYHSPLSLEIEALYTKPDLIEIHSRNPNTGKYYYRTTTVKGSNDLQKFKFGIPYSDQIIIDIVNNPDQDSILITSIHLVGYDNYDTLDKENLLPYFSGNQFIQKSTGRYLKMITKDENYNPKISLKDLSVYYSFNPSTLLRLIRFLFLVVAILLASLIWKHWSFRNLERSHLQLIVLLQAIFLCILLSKGIERFLFSDLWAEDGRVNLKEAFVDPSGTLFRAKFGFYHTFSKLIAIISTLLPLKMIPYAFTLASFFTYTYVSSVILRNEYGWLIPDPRFRIMIMLLFLFAPGLNIMLGNLTNLHWFLLFWLGLLSIKDISYPYTAWDYIFAFISISSAGAAIVYLPVFAYRALINRKSKLLSQELVMILLLVIFGLLNYQASAPPDGLVFSLDSLRIFFLHSFGFVLEFPIFGDHLTVWLLQHPVFLYSAGAVLLALLTISNRSFHWRKEYLILLLFLFCTCIVPVLISFSREHNLQILLDFFHFDEMAWFGFRYAYILPAAGFVFWFFIFSRESIGKRLRWILVTLILAVHIMSSGYRYTLEPYNYDQHWVSNPAEIEYFLKTGCPEVLEIPLSPQNMFMRLKATDLNLQCKER